MADNMTPGDLDIDPSSDTPQQLYRWFLASILFGKPIQQNVAADTYRTLIDRGFTSPKKFADIGTEPLRKLLDDGRYARFDYQMADYLHEIMSSVVADYGSVHRLVTTAQSQDDLRNRVENFRGIGAVTARIFIEQLSADVIGSAQSPSAD